MERLLDEIICTWWFAYGFIGTIVFIVIELCYEKKKLTDILFLLICSLIPMLNWFTAVFATFFVISFVTEPIYNKLNSTSITFMVEKKKKHKKRKKHDRTVS